MDGGQVEASLPVDVDFGLATAMLILGPYMSPGLPSASATADCANLTVTDNGDGTFTLDGDCTVGDITVDFDNVTIDAINGTIDGTVTLLDANGDPLLSIVFDQNTATVFDADGNEIAAVTF